ncbi:MAG: hypoxanthine phosphoribosyltransferase [Pseudomonadota bacterium]
MIQEMIPVERLKNRIGALAQEIVSEIGPDFVMVGLLKGSFIFMADLTRALSRAGATPQIEFIRLSSYGMSKESAGEVHLLGDVPTEVAGKKVLLVDDIADTGRSLAYAHALLAQREPEGIWSCALLDKPSRREIEIAIDFTGFPIDDVFVAGYGIDYAENYRHLPFIGIVG